MLVINIYFLIPFVSTHAYGVANPLIYVLISPCVRYASSLTWKCWHRCQLKPSTYIILIRFARIHVYVRKQLMLGRAKYNFTCRTFEQYKLDAEESGILSLILTAVIFRGRPSWRFPNLGSFTLQRNTKESLSSTKYFTGILFNSCSSSSYIFHGSRKCVIPVVCVCETRRRYVVKHNLITEVYLMTVMETTSH